MQNKKKVISVILALIIALSAWSVVPFTANAAEVKIAATAETEGDYDYDVLDDGTAEITGYTGEGGDITIPSTLGGYTVTSIGIIAFGFTELTSVTIPDSVTSIGVQAFSYCSELTSVTIPDSVTSIGDNAFYGCTGLTSIKVAEGNTVFDSRDNCNAIIKTESNTLVYGCKNTVIPDSVTSIGDNAFKGCTGLTSVTIPDSVTSIGDTAFYDCKELMSVTIPDSVVSIGDHAFGYYYYRVHFEYMHIVGFIIYGYEGSAAEKYADDNGFALVTPGEFKYTVQENGTAMITEYTGKGGYVFIPSTLDGYTVTSIGEGAFKGCTRLTRVTIPDSVTSIGSNAFYECVSLVSVTIPNSVTSIGRCAFHGCTGLTRIDIPDSVTSIGYWAFYGCEKLMSIDIPESVTSIGDWAFGNTAWYCNQPDGLIYINKVAYKMKGKCPSEVDIKDGTLGIAGSAFKGCTELTSITIPDSVTSIGDSAFDGCTGLSRVTIPDSVTSIGRFAFGCCTGLTSITIPDSVISIGDFAFYICTSLTNIDIPESVTSIGDHVFDYCTGLSSIKVAEGNTVFDSRDNCNAIIKTESNTLVYGFENTVIPDSVTSIGDHAFENCTGPTTIAIPDSITSIGVRAFYGYTILTSVTIPDSVTSIGNEAFGYYAADFWSCKLEGFTIYGYEGSEAEKYAKDNEFTFVPLKSKTDEATGIILDIPEDTALTIKDITAEIISSMPAENSKMTAYDISLTKDGETVQPENIVPVKIPCSNENAKVYRLEADGNLTDMNAKYADGYMVFTTDHFSVYVLAEPNVKTGVTVSGTITSYVDDSDVTIKLTGADNNFTAEVKGKADYSIEAVPAGKYTLTVSKANHVTREYTVTVSDTNVTQDVKISPKGDVNGDGETDIMDCSLAQRYIRELTTLDAYQIACGDVSGTGDGELDIQDVSRILRHIRELAMLY